ncbi:hypothetical protein [Clavibacter michiganensis]|nr:hypothetical protein [Clavibacter michiganensis]MDO4130868.1 hypothetical protein [Clavibacter michiganensis]MDO4136993.1 hypothetical protein [Clavibacter michiganensis]
MTTAAGFLIYLIATGREANQAVLSTWIASSVVQIIGLLAIITRHLFPKNAISEAPDTSK